MVPIISYHVGHIYNQLMFSTYITQINWELFNELARIKIVFGVPMRHSTLYSLTVIYLLQEAIWTALPAIYNAINCIYVAIQCKSISKAVQFSVK